MRLQRQLNDVDDQPIIKAAKRKYAVRYVKAESIPTCATSILNSQTWMAVLSSFIRETNKVNRGYASDDEDDDNNDNEEENQERMMIKYYNSIWILPLPSKK